MNLLGFLQNDLIQISRSSCLSTMCPYKSYTKKYAALFLDITDDMVLFHGVVCDG